MDKIANEEESTTEQSTEIDLNGGEGSSSTDKYIDSDSNWEPVPCFDISHSGYRLFIIDEDLRRISPTYDFRFSTPNKIVDISYDTRFDSDISPDEHEKYNISVLETWCTNDLTTKSWETVPYPVIGTGGSSGHQSNGENFKKWILAGLSSYQ